MTKRFLTCIFLPLLAVTCLHSRELTPGVYREYTLSTRTVPNGWRVTDPQVVNAGGLEFLPNPVFTFKDVDLSDAVRAQITMHHWAGHSDSTGQQFILNGDHFADIPLNPNLDPFVLFAPEYYLNADNPVIDIPLEWVEEGDNSIQGTFAEEEQGKHWWGQWGWYWIGLRLHLENQEVPPVSGNLVVEAPDKVISGETVTLRFETEDAGITHVDFYARYYGFDEDGDAIYYDWHGFGRAVDALPDGAIGRVREAPYTVEWDVSRIPDQQAGAVGFAVVVKRGTNEFHVMEPELGYSIERDYSIKMFRPSGFPYQLIRNGQEGGATLHIPEVYPIETASSARMLIRTWNGQNNEQGSTPVRINYNDYKLGIVTGANHDYGFDDDPVDVTELIPGRNIIWFTSSTTHHGCEVLAPGPILLVRWDEPVPDYLESTIILPGWYTSNVGEVYFDPKDEDWLYSRAFSWMHPYRLFAESGWYYSTRLGFIWTGGFFPWIYLQDEAAWLYYLGEEGDRLHFYHSGSGETVLLPAEG